MRLFHTPTAYPQPGELLQTLTLALRRTAPIVVASLAVLLTGGCLDFEKQTTIVAFPTSRDQLQLLLVYEGLYVFGDCPDQLKDAKTQLTEFVTSESQFCLGDNWIGRISLDPAADDSPPTRRLKALLRKHLVIRNGGFFFNETGDLCGYQLITVNQVGTVVRELNALLSKAILHSLDKLFVSDGTEPQERDTSSFEKWDVASLLQMQQAARNRHQWIHFEPGRFSVSVFMTPGTFTRLKRETLRDFLDVHETVPTPVPIPLVEPVPPMYESGQSTNFAGSSQTRTLGVLPRSSRRSGAVVPPTAEQIALPQVYRTGNLSVPTEHTTRPSNDSDWPDVESGSDFEQERRSRLIATLAETHWSLDQRHDRVTTSFGLGNGKPIHFVSDNGPRRFRKHDADLRAHAQSLNGKLIASYSTKRLLEDFEANRLSVREGPAQLRP